MDRNGAFGLSSGFNSVKNEIVTPPPPPLERKASSKVPMNLSVSSVGRDDEKASTDALNENKVEALSGDDVKACGNSTMVLFCSCCVWH